MTVPEGSAYGAAVALAAVFTVAAVAKVRDPAGTARGFRALGVPRPWPAARAVPAVEAAVAAALLVVPAVGGTAALTLLAAFSVFLGSRLRAGVTAPCRCFGGRGGHGLSWADLGRNLWLAGAAVVATTAAGPTVPSAVAVLLTAAGTIVAGGSIRLCRWLATP